MEQGHLIDFRMYRPASVLVIDLVKHSTRSKSTIQFVQKTIEEILHRAKQALNLGDVYFNYTGDGYVCAFVGNSSARILDFINSTIPELERRFAQYNQQIRAGLDFGLVHLSKNALTGAPEHFDLPGIVAARLEKVASPGQILCTETVFKLFSPHYPHMFSEAPKTVKTKDRKIMAYVLSPFDFIGVRKIFSDFLLRKPNLRNERSSTRKKILIVDDEPVIRKFMSDVLRTSRPNYQVFSAASAEEALGIFRPHEFAAVITDCYMVGMSGLDLLECINDLDKEQLVIMVTGYGSIELAVKFMKGGGFDLLLKPFSVETMIEAFDRAVEFESRQVFRNNLEILCEDMGNLLWLMKEVSDEFGYIQKQVNKPDDIAHSLLRHKAKQLIVDFIALIQPGVDIMEYLSTVRVQLACVARLSKIIGLVRINDLRRYLNQFLSDLKKLNPEVHFSLNDKSNKNTVSSGVGTTVILIICELIDNAISAIDRSGEIDITLSVLESSNSLQIVVRDNGPGISESIVKRMFEAGVSTKGPGRGLGLCLLQETVRSLHGEILYEYHKGATFSVILPLN